MDAPKMEAWSWPTEEREDKMIGLEDFHEDILGKAMRGLSIGKNEMAKRLGVEKLLVDKILNGAVDTVLINAMATELKLDAGKLIQSARQAWSPDPVQLKGLKQFNTSYGDMLVNAYVLWEDDSRKAWVFDTGTDAEPILQFLSERNLEVDAIFLTHTHRDHIDCLDRLRDQTGSQQVYVHKLELLAGCEAVEEGFEYSVDSLSLKVKHTYGHSVGGVTYIIKGLATQVAVVGDAIFAGSMGGGMISYEDALQNNRDKIMTLAAETIVCPGHGPITTVKWEKERNPFFPEF